jgi:hypothetical protein
MEFMRTSFMTVICRKNMGIPTFNVIERVKDACVNANIAVGPVGDANEKQITILHTDANIEFVKTSIENLLLQ